MSVRVKLQEVVDELEIVSDEMLSFVDVSTGRIECVTREILSDVEEGEEEEELSGWEHDEWEVANKVVAKDETLRRLPTRFDIDEWSIMRDFAESLNDQRQRNDLLRALGGSGAFRYFKDTVFRCGMREAWYAYKARALRDIAIEWCEENGIKWE